MRLNVRCCCQPTKILGTLEVPDHCASHGFMATIHEMPASYIDPNEIPTTNHEWIELKRFGLGTPPELAVYSDDRPVEFWRKLPSFKEGDAV